MTQLHHYNYSNTFQIIVLPLIFVLYTGCQKYTIWQPVVPIINARLITRNPLSIVLVQKLRHMMYELYPKFY